MYTVAEIISIPNENLNQFLTIFNIDINTTTPYYDMLTLMNENKILNNKDEDINLLSHSQFSKGVDQSWIEISNKLKNKNIMFLPDKISAIRFLINVYDLVIDNSPINNVQLSENLIVKSSVNPIIQSIIQPSLKSSVQIKRK